ncbi:MAG: indole-3-glycerol phosphate synthase TrpC [Lentisphaerota bacterium]
MNKTPNILDRIVADKRLEIAARKHRNPLHPGEAAAKNMRPGFVASLRSVPIGLIAEVKRKSPSAGPIREPFVPADIAACYERAGDQAISVLMDEKYFGGGEEQFKAVRSAVALPLLYKEFVIDFWQLHHAVALGASAVLLIAAVLPPATLQAFLLECDRLGLEALVEVHDEEEMEIAAGLNCHCIGINNRDLKTFKTSLETTFRLACLAPRDCTVVSESGIRSHADIRRLQDAGIRAVLVGESLLRSQDLEQSVHSLMGRT